MIKSFAEIWEEEKAKLKKEYMKELKENKGLVKLGVRKTDKT